MMFGILFVVCLAVTHVHSQALVCNFDTAAKGSTTLPCTCDGSACDLIQETSDQYDWTAHQGKTQSDPTGPDDDHTLQNGQGLYIYAEATPQVEQDQAIVKTNTIDLQGQTSCLTFWYHMFGQHVRLLEVNVTFNGGSSAVLWQKNKAQGTEWLEAAVSLPPTVTSVAFVVTKGTGINQPFGDIALDDVMIERQLCPGVSVPTGETITSTSDVTTPTSTTTTTTSTTPQPTISEPSQSQRLGSLWGLNETLWIIILVVAGAVILVLIIVVCVQACALRRMRTARIVRQSDDYSNIEAYKRDPYTQDPKQDNYINAYDNMALESEDKEPNHGHTNGGGLI